MENGKLWVNNCITAYHNHTIIVKLCVLRKNNDLCWYWIFLNIIKIKAGGVLMENGMSCVGKCINFLIESYNHH
jgi:hypothetical protein